MNDLEHTDEPLLPRPSDPLFERWVEATDAYAEAVHGSQEGAGTFKHDLDRLSRELRQIEAQIKAHRHAGSPGPQRRAGT
ncbi:MAG: hypothetical protein EOO22_10540 [Comamonadaceae bacterium]|nr:MAG: hypothetical protein EOO22_10540 [Comamonadaceae bacterium]